MVSGCGCYPKAGSRAKRTGKVFLNFQNADISLVVKFMSELTGKNIVLGPNVKGTITISSAKPVSINQTWDLFVMSLTLQGDGVVEDKNFVRILPIAFCNFMPVSTEEFAVRIQKHSSEKMSAS